MPDPQDPTQQPETPPQPQHPAQATSKLSISPASTTLTSGQAIVFACSSTQPVTWSLLPSQERYYGSLHEKSGAYTAPKRFIARGRTAVVQATSGNEVATASVTISSDPFWRNAVGIALMLLLIPILFLAKREWPVSCRCEYAPVITPAFAWRNPGDTLQFDLVSCPPKPTTIFWKIASGSGAITDAGLYMAPDAPTDAVVQALDSGQKVIASAVVHVAANSRLDLSPPSIAMFPGQRQTFTLSPEGPAPPIWSTDPQAGELKQLDNKPGQWTYTASSAIAKPGLVRIIATAPPVAGSNVRRAVAAIVQLKGCDEDANSGKKIFWFVFWMGVLGSYIHAAGSFAAYAGNRTFVSSWTWWYCLRPPIGGLLAILVFFLFGGGLFGQGDISNAYLVASYAGLVGLFSEVALLKLKEIIETLFKPRDDRADKLKEGQTASAKPVISAVAAEDVAAKRYAVTGSGFTAESRVKVNGVERQTTFVSNVKLTFTLDAGDTGTLRVTVTNTMADGTTVDSPPFTLTV